MLSIYGVPVSVHTRKAILTAMLKDIAYQLQPVIPFDPPAGWAQLSPTGLIPVIEHDGFVLADSTAICLYLDRMHRNAPILPDDPREAGRVLWFNAYASDLFRGVVHGLFVQKVIRPRILKQGDADAAEIERIQSGPARKMLGYLDTQVDGEWLVGGRMTLADIAIVSTLINYLYLDFDLDSYPRLAAYMARAVCERVFARALEGERPFAEQMGLSSAFLR